MAIKAGWYKFNGVLTAPSRDLSVNIPFKIHVELSASVGMDEYTCSEMKVMADGEVRYVLTDGNIGSAESDVEFPYELTAYKDGWRTEYGYVDTIEVQADTEVSDEFAEWFAISTNPTDEPDEPDTPDTPDIPDVPDVPDVPNAAATIAYNGSTIASLLGGQKATLKCAGMTMESDVVVDVAEVDIPEGDIPEGYVKPEGALYISRNGTHDVTNFAEAVVNVKAEAETPDQNSVVPLTITENGVYEAPGKPDYKIEWDGNTEGLERVGQMYFVSDFEINDVEELNGIHGVYINGNSTEESELTFSPFSITGYEGYQGEGYFSSGLTSTFCWYVPGKGFAFNKSGDRYYTKSITIPAGGDPIVGYSPITVNVKGGGADGGVTVVPLTVTENGVYDTYYETDTEVWDSNTEYVGSVTVDGVTLSFKKAEKLIVPDDLKELKREKYSCVIEGSAVDGSGSTNLPFTLSEELGITDGVVATFHDFVILWVKMAAPLNAQYGISFLEDNTVYITNYPQLMMESTLGEAAVRTSVTAPSKKVENAAFRPVTVELPISNEWLSIDALAGQTYTRTEDKYYRRFGVAGPYAIHLNVTPSPVEQNFIADEGGCYTKVTVGAVDLSDLTKNHILCGIYLKTMPKTEYKVGEWINTSTGVLLCQYTDGTTEEKQLLDDYIYGNFSMDEVGTYPVTVKYTEGGITSQTMYYITITA